MAKRSLRDEYKGKNVKDYNKNRDEDSKQQKEIRVNSFEDNDFLKIETGWNNFRLAPQKGSIFKLRVRYWLPYQDDKNKTFNIPILDASVHGHPKIEKDPVNVYLTWLKDNLSEYSSKKQEKIEKYINGKDTKVAPEIKHVSWAWNVERVDDESKVKDFGLLELGKSIKEQIDSEVDDDDEEEVNDMEPFTDPDSGKILKIKKDKEISFKMYKVKLGQELTLSDKNLEKVQKSKTLNEIFDNVYSMDMFRKAITGLEMLDKAMGIDILDNPEVSEDLKEIEKSVKKYGATAKPSKKDDEKDDSKKDNSKKENKLIKIKKKVIKKNR